MTKVNSSIMDVADFTGETPDTFAAGDHGHDDIPFYTWKTPTEPTVAIEDVGFVWWDTNADLFKVLDSILPSVWIELNPTGSLHDHSNPVILDGDLVHIGFNPGVGEYIPDATIIEADDEDDLAAHLKGIATALGTVTGDATDAIDLSVNGYVTFTNGLIIQWGNVTVNGYATLGVTFNIAFNTVFHAFANTSASQPSYDTTMRNLTTIGGDLFNGDNTQQTCSWIAIGM